MAVEERKIEVEGTPIRYLMAGEGPPLVLLHALGEGAFDWQWVLPDLAQTYRVYAPDLPGFGDSARPEPITHPPFLRAFRLLSRCPGDRAHYDDRQLAGRPRRPAFCVV